MILKKQAGYGALILLIIMMIGGGISWENFRLKKNHSQALRFGYHALKINGNYVNEAIFQDEQNQFFLRWHRTAMMLRKSDEERNDLLLDAIINRVGLEDFLLKRSGILVRPQEIKYYINHYIKSKYATKLEFDEYLDSVSCGDEKDLRKLIRLYLLKVKYYPHIAPGYGVTVSDREIETAFQHQKSENWAVVLQHILLSSKQNDAIQDRWKLATKINEQLRQGADFAMLAEKYSDDRATKNKGGQIEPLAKEKVPPLFANKIFDTRPGQLIAPFSTEYGIEIVKIVKFNSFYHSRAEIKNMLLVDKFEKSPRFNDWFSKIKTQMVIKITDPALAAYRAFKNNNYQTAGRLYLNAYQRYQQEFYFYRAFQSYRAAEKWDQVTHLSQLGIQKFGYKVPYYIYGAEGFYHKKQTVEALKLLKTAVTLSAGNVVDRELTLQMYSKLGLAKEAKQ